jgi:chromosome segregation ATPase
MKTIFILSVLFTFRFATAGSDIVSSARDWNLAIKSNVCYAFTEGDREEQDYQFGVMLPKESNKLAEWYIVRTGRGAKVPALQGGLGANPILMQFGIVSSGSAENFIYLGNRSLASVMEALTSTKEIKFAPPNNETKPVQFSLRGLAETVAELEKRCNKGQSILRPQFDNLFLQGIPAVVDAAKMDIARTTNLRGLLARAYDLFNQTEGAKKELADLKAKYGSELVRAEQLDFHINDLKNNLIPAKQRSISETERSLVNSRSELANVNARLPGLEAAIVPLQADYKNKKEILDQVAPEHDRLQNEVDEAESNLDNAQSSLEATIRRLANNRSEQQQLEARARSLSSEIQSLERDRVDAQSDLRQAQSELDRFDLRWEIEKRRQADPGYNQAKNDVSRYERESQMANNEVNRKRADRDRADQSLRQCQSTPGADCTVQQAEQREANRQLDIAKDQERDVNRRLWSARNEVERIERNAEREARQIQDRLINNRDRAQRRFDDIDNSISSKRREIDSIQMTQLPNLRSEESQLESREQSLRGQIPGLRNSLQSAKSALNAYDARVGYAGKKASADLALSKLNAAKSEFRRAQDQKTTLERNIQEFLQRLQAFKNDLAQMQNDLAQSQNELRGLQPVLDRYRAEKAPIDSRINGLNSAFASTRAEYLKSLTGGN